MEIEFQFGKCFICHNDSGVSQACSSCMRKLTLDETYIPAKPISYVNNTSMDCSYCNTITPFIRGTINFGIRYCLTHKQRAEADMKSWLITNDSVLVGDFKQDYPDLYRILENGIKLRRSDKRVDYNWKLDRQRLIYKHPNFGWIFNFYKYEPCIQSNPSGNKITKNIPLAILLTDDYSIFFKHMITNLVNRLDQGFYK